MSSNNEEVALGSIYQVKVDAKSTMDEGIGKVGDVVLFIKNAKTRMGNTYKVKVTKVYRTFAYCEIVGNPTGIVGNGSVIEYM